MVISSRPTRIHIFETSFVGFDSKQWAEVKTKFSVTGDNGKWNELRYMSENHRHITDTYSNSHHKKRLSHSPNKKLPSVPYRSSQVARRWKFLSAENEIQLICHLFKAIQFSSLHWYANHNRIPFLDVHLSRFHRRMCRRSTLKVFQMWVNCILI